MSRSLRRLILSVLAICLMVPIAWLTFASRPHHQFSSPTSNPALPSVRMVPMSPQHAFEISDLISDLIFAAFFQFPVILIAEFAAVIYLSRKQVKQRLLWISGSYLLLVSLAMALALLSPDEFGFSFIPVVMTVWPWCHILSKFPGPSTMGISGLFIGVSLGAILNCTIFYLIDRLSYPKHSARL